MTALDELRKFVQNNPQRAAELGTLRNQGFDIPELQTDDDVFIIVCATRESGERRGLRPRPGSQLTKCDGCQIWIYLSPEAILQRKVNPGAIVCCRACAGLDGGAQS